MATDLILTKCGSYQNYQLIEFSLSVATSTVMDLLITFFFLLLFSPRFTLFILSPAHTNDKSEVREQYIEVESKIFDPTLSLGHTYNRKTITG